MLMWQLIFTAVMLVAVSSVLYLCAKTAQLGFIVRLAHGHSILAEILGISVVAVVFGVLVYTLNITNAIICMVHLAVFRLLCGGALILAEKYFSLPYRSVYADLSALIICTVYLSAGWYLDHHVFVTRYEVLTDKNIENLRIVHFADSHLDTTFDGEGFSGHLKAIQEQNPDIVLLTGDYVDDDTTREDMILACRALGKIQAKYGVYFAFGNHDEGYYSPLRRGFSKYDLVEELRKNGVKVLQDETELLNDMFYIVGRKDASEKERGRTRQSMSELTEKLNPEKFAIVMDHQPNDYDSQQKTGVDLVLSGHTHGGQLFPLNRLGEWIGANDKTYGLEKRGNTTFIVTSGISDWTVKFKTGCKSEIVVIDVKRK